MPGKFLVLLPASEGKATGGPGPPLNLDAMSFSALNRMRTRISNALIKLSRQPRVSRRLLGVKGVALERAMADNASIEESPTLPSIERYTGVMYDAIGYRTLTKPARESFNESAVTFSGLFGLVRPPDMIPAYKLKMSAALLRSRSCAAHWKPFISAELAAGGYGVIWDLLPIEHSAAWEPSMVPCEIRFSFKFLQSSSNGGTKTVSHLSKLLKGSLARHIVSNSDSARTPASALELVEAFEHPDGYRFHPGSSSLEGQAKEIVYLK